MSVLVVMLCLNSMASCTEATSPEVLRVEMQNLLCDDTIPKLLERVRADELNPANGFYKLACRRLGPEA